MFMQKKANKRNLNKGSTGEDNQWCHSSPGKRSTAADLLAPPEVFSHFMLKKVPSPLFYGTVSLSWERQYFITTGFK